jgi:hypothetical protein
MSTPLDEARTKITRQVLGARTLPEIAAARQTLREWLAAHPDEQGMRWGFEQLAQMQEAAELEAEEPALPDTAPVT